MWVYYALLWLQTSTHWRSLLKYTHYWTSYSVHGEGLVNYPRSQALCSRFCLAALESLGTRLLVNYLDLFRHMHQLRELSWLLLCTARLPWLHSTLSPDAVKAILARLSRSTAKTAPRWPSNLRTRAQWRMSHMIACRVGWQWGISGSDYYVDSFDIKLMFHQSEGSAVVSHLCKLSYPNLHLSNPLK